MTPGPSLVFGARFDAELDPAGDSAGCQRCSSRRVGVPHPYFDLSEPLVVFERSVDQLAAVASGFDRGHHRRESDIALGFHSGNDRQRFLDRRVCELVEVLRPRSIGSGSLLATGLLALGLGQARRFGHAITLGPCRCRRGRQDQERRVRLV